MGSTLGVMVIKDSPALYDERLVRRFEPGTIEMLTRDVLNVHGFVLSFTRGLRGVRIRDKHDNYKNYTWAELEKFVDGLRLAVGKEPLYSARARVDARAVKRALLKKPEPKE